MISVVIPTFMREQPLVDTITQLLEQGVSDLDLIVVDQTPEHMPDVDKALNKWNDAGAIRLLKQSEPSIPRAMNRGLNSASHTTVLFLDDDIRIKTGFLGTHIDAHKTNGEGFVAGQVLQPWQMGPDHVARSNVGVTPDEFDFSSGVASSVERVMAGNLSVNRDLALALGGFDENFTGAAYRFEAEFSDRARHARIPIRFEPAASIEHLQAESGGTRAHGHFLTTASHAHTSGKYYYLLVAHNVPGRWRTILSMPFKSVMTRHHLRKPWWIPVSLIAEARGLFDAAVKARSGRRLLAEPITTVQSLEACSIPAPTPKVRAG